MAPSIAVIGLACRLPDEVSCPEDLWQQLLAQKDTRSLPTGRWNADAFHHHGSNKPQTIAAREAHFLKRDIRAFDAAFFNINAAEALALDPQQRLVLELIYEALESSGLTLDTVSGTKTGCYIGSSSSDYRDSIARDTEVSPRYTVLGINTEMLSNRASWFYNLKGPSLTVATACSSSLVAIHMACQSLLSGESDMAIAGGVNLMLNPDFPTYYTNMTMLSPDGRCKSFDASGDGYGRGEGCGIVLLKRLDDAIRDNAPIRAVIRGSGVNSDGYTQGFTMPSSESQADLIREVYAKAGLDMSDTQFVECHGTGTKAGDPIETKAIYETLGQKAKRSQPLVIGSVKPNIGHLEGASGVASLVKSILALEKGYIPPQMFFRTPNPKIPLQEWNLHVPTALMPWPPTRGPRRVSINNFGVGGTNSHLVIESAPEPRSVTVGPSAEKKRLFVLSSRDRDGLVRVARSMAEHMEKTGDGSAAYAANLAYTLGNKRTRFQWKKFCVAEDLADLRTRLLALTSEDATRSNAAPRVGFIFTGQGAQWPLMGLKLMEFAVFKSSFQKCQVYLKELGCPWNAAEELAKPAESSRIKSPELSQPLCTILQIGIVDLLATWGVSPSKVVGHSSGEIAAAYSAGFITAKEAVQVAYLRGKFCDAMAAASQEPRGGMIAVGCSPERAEELISESTAGYLTVACINSPSGVTISGDMAAIEQLYDRLKGTSVFAAKLKVDMAYHSEHMSDVYPQYVQALTHIRPGDNASQSGVVMVSSVESMPVQAADLDGFYWGRNLVSPVLFSDALKELVQPADEHGDIAVDLLVEIGPHSALKQSVKEILGAASVQGVQYLSSLSRGMDDQDMVLSLAGNLFVAGVPVDLAKVNDDPGAVLLTNLPPYPWLHTAKFDATPRVSREHNMRPHPQSSLLGAPMPSMTPGEHVWRGYLHLDQENWVRDHKVTGVVIYPGAGLIAMALEAGCQLAEPGRKMRSIKLRDVTIASAAMVSLDKATEFVVHCRPHQLGTKTSGPAAWQEFTISSSGGPDIPLRENCTGLMRVEYYLDGDLETMAKREENAAVVSSLAKYRTAMDACEYDLPVDQFYQDFANVGLAVGPAFRNVKKLRFRPGQAVYEASIGDPGETFDTGRPGRPHLIHPTTLDSILSTPFAAYYGGPGAPPTKPYIPVCFQELEISADMPFETGTPLRGCSTATKYAVNDLESDMYVFDDASTDCYLKIRGYRATSDIASDADVEEETQVPGLCYQTRQEASFKLLTKEQLETIITNSGLTSDEKLQKVARMILHESPTTVLEVFAENPKDSSVSLITKNVALSPSQQIMYAVTGGSPAGSGKDFMELKPGSKPDKTFDLVVAGQNCSEWFKDKSSLETLLGHVKPGGRLICGFPLSLNGKVDLFSDDTGSIAIFTAPEVTNGHTNGDLEHLQEVLIIEPATASAAISSFSSDLVSMVSSQGYKAHIVTWTPDLGPDTFSNKAIVSLLELETPCMDKLSQRDFAAVKNLLVKATSLVWITGFEGPSAFVIDGVLRVVRRELGNESLKALHLRSLANGPALATKVLFGSSVDNEFLEEDGLLKVSRVYEDKEFCSQVSSHAGTAPHMESIKDCEFPLCLGISKPGLLDTLRFAPTKSYGKLQDDEVEIQIQASGLNFRDVMISMGIITYPYLGYEGAGVVLRTGSKVTGVKPGDRVSAHILGSHANVARTPEILCAQMPDDMSFETGAALPVVFTTAYHALVNLARLRKGQSVLIHAAAGGVGQAAIQIARHLGLEIYATVGSAEKRKFITKTYNIPEERIFSSRNASFVTGLKRLTGGRGVNCVLNSLSGELLRQSLYCLAPLGTFVELGSRDVGENTRLDMAPFANGITFTCFTLLEILNSDPDLMSEIWRNTFDLIRSGALSAPTPLTVMPVDHIKDAFRLMQSGKHRGKIVLSFDSNGKVPIVLEPSVALRLNATSTYLLVGGLGGLGRSLANMLVASGARNIAFISRSGAVNPEAKAVVDALSAHATVRAYAADVADPTALAKALERCSQDLPPIRGVFQMSMVLRDGIFEKMTHEEWTDAIEPKIDGTRNLHHYFGPERPLDFFIMCSSISGIIGNRGQANYAAGNLFQNALAHHRRALGMAGCAVDLGIMRDVGVLAETGATGDLVAWEQLLGIREPVFLALMKAAINGERRRGTFPAQVSVGLATAATFENAGLDVPNWLVEDVRFSHLATVRSNTASNSSDNPAKVGAVTMAQRLATVESKDEAVSVLIDGLVDKISVIVSMPASEVDPSRPLFMYGVDSLVAMEIRNWIQRDVKSDIALFDVLEAVPITKFAEKVALRSRLCQFNKQI
ncbi:hypothetical protein MCOR25_010479 [Pyricularia grisea]|nr:hypothetical protein MCOR25_010479 [Pyricularia grisea]